MDKYIFAITGPTGSGKSTVSNIFRSLGVYVADADKAAKEVTAKGAECLERIRDAFGESVITENGELNRKKLSQIVFNDDKKLKLLNEITHSYIKKRIENEFAQSDCDILAIDGAVIIGSPVAELIKKLIVVIADKDLRIKRIMKRDNISFEAADSRISAQMSDEEYMANADFIIKNNDDDVGLEECIERIYSKIKDFSKTESSQS